MPDGALMMRPPASWPTSQRLLACSLTHLPSNSRRLASHNPQSPRHAWAAHSTANGLDTPKSGISSAIGPSSRTRVALAHDKHLPLATPSPLLFCQAWTVHPLLLFMCLSRPVTCAESYFPIGCTSLLANEFTHSSCFWRHIRSPRI